MNTIDIDFDVFKEITVRRKTEEITPNDVLRELFGLQPIDKEVVEEHNEGKSWVIKNVAFPHGTEFRSRFKGKVYKGQIKDGALEVDGERFTSPSSAAGYVTGNSVNGWNFWECRLPGLQAWRTIKDLRK